MSVDRMNNLSVVKIYNNLYETDYRDLHEEIVCSLDDNAPNIVIDMTDLDFINSTGISFLLKVKKSTEEHGGDIAIAVVNDRVKSILGSTRLFDYFNPEDNIYTAMQHFQ